MKAISKLRQRFREHIDNCLFIFVLFLVAFGSLLVALGVVAMFSDGTAIYLQQLLGLSEESKELREKYGMLKALGFCIVGVLLILQALAANKRANAMDATAKNTEEGQRQERLKNAIGHLGHDRDSVRMGGAYELFHLAKDTEGLRQTVMDILCAHIRQTTTGQTTRGKDYQVEHKIKPSEEIQSLLSLLFREEHDVFEDCSIKLQDSYLNGANLSQARLKKANLIEAQLQGAVLWLAQMQEAKLFNAQLQGASLFKARLQEAKLGAARLQGTNFMNAKLRGADLREAQLQGAELREAQLQGAELWSAQMQGADLMMVQLQGADLMNAQLQAANLYKTQLQGADLEYVQLQGADLEYVQLQGISSQAYPLSLAGFERKISERIGKPSDLKGIVFAGGLQEEGLDTLCEGLSAGKAQALREKLSSHVGELASNKLHPDRGADTRTSYTKEEAERWIAEYNKAMEGVPRTDDTADAASTSNSDKDKGD